tara:strand:+ start:1480 stop:1839 length:360 start_codon:yes stop_codon:yes gene_type:complete
MSSQVLSGVSKPSLADVARTIRHRAPNEGNLLPNLGKTLIHHQVLPATMQTRVANRPRTDVGKAVLSGTGGNPRIVNQALQTASRIVSPISHFESRARMAMGVARALKHTPAHPSLISR